MREVEGFHESQSWEYLIQGVGRIVAIVEYLRFKMFWIPRNLGLHLLIQNSCSSTFVFLHSTNAGLVIAAVSASEAKASH